MFGDNGGMSLGITEEIIARQPPEAQAIIRLLLARIAELETQVEELTARIEALERQGKGKTPQNSSLPPSTQHPHARPQPPRRKSKRKRGGQPGHEKHERPLIPTEDCNHVEPLKPTECRRCGESLSGSDPEPLRHQVWELPEIKPIVTEYQRHRLVCPACGETTCAPLPAGVPEGQSGPRLMAFVALLMAYYRQSKRRTADFLSTLLGQPCWAHLKRDFQAMIDSGDPRAKHLGFRLRHATCELFEHWADYRDGRISRAALLRRMGPVRRKVESLLARGTQCGHADTRGTCRELHEHRPWLWTFLRHEGIEPTNNAGERSLRHAVIWRKLSFGTQSASGSRFVETMLTVIETCRQQGRNVSPFLTNAVEAHLAHQPAPSLHPGA